jgi:hypothetical protein
MGSRRRHAHRARGGGAGDPRVAAVIPARPLLLVLALGMLCPPGAGAQQAGENEVMSQQEDPGSDPSGIFGREPDRRRLIAGMWAMHPFEPHFPEMDHTRGFGAQLSQWFVATFVNSYDVRAFVAGLERYWLERRVSLVDVGIGYRLGIVTGYDERLLTFARHTPLLPFGGLLLWAEVGPVGADLFYVYRAITFEGSLRF